MKVKVIISITLESDSTLKAVSKVADALEATIHYLSNTKIELESVESEVIDELTEKLADSQTRKLTAVSSMEKEND